MAVRLLIVDDSSLQRRALVSLLAPYDVDIVEAEDGLQALSAVRAQPPNLVLLDYNMPVLDGLGFLRALRADEEFARTHVIMLTANAAPATLAAAARLHVRDYLIKPCDGPTLISKISRVVPITFKPDAVASQQGAS
jgi:two-component system chemotaxis response regulator CheY